VLALVSATRRAAAGDFRAAGVASPAPDLSARDEIALLGAAVGEMLADLRDRDALEAVRLGPDEGDGDARAGERTRAVTDGAPGPRRTRALALHAPDGDDAAPGAGPPRRGRVLAGRWALEATVGEGSTGVVWRARDLTLGEPVAVKVLRPALALAHPAALDAFKEELRVARRLSHRHVVRLHDIGVDGSLAFLTMELVRGPALATVLATRGALPAAAVLALGKQLLRALDAAHGQGVVHGDVKPSNLLLGAGGVLKVTDFGVARLMHAPHPVREAADAPDAVGRIAGAVVGTPAFLAPELLLGAAPGVRSDLYASGVVLQACLSGASPYDDDTPLAFFTHKLETPARHPSDEPATLAAQPMRAATAVGGVAGAEQDGGRRPAPAAGRGHPGAVVREAAAGRGAPGAADDALRAGLVAVAAALASRDPGARPPTARAAHHLLARLG
jgi:serine/threonine-protein kinase